MAVDTTGNVYVADSGNHTIRKMTQAGVVTTLAGSAGSSGNTDGTGSAARFSSPYGVAVDTTGNVYVADSGNHTIRKVTPDGIVTTLAGSAGIFGSTNGTGSAARFRDPQGVALDSTGNIYVADTYNHTIRKVTSAGVVTTFAGTVGSGSSGEGDLLNPLSIAIDITGNLYVSNRSLHSIRKVTPAGIITTFAGQLINGSSDGTGSAALFNNPYGMAADNLGNVYVADGGNHTIRKMTTAGVVTTLAGVASTSGRSNGTGSAARFNFPYGVAVDSTGNVYVADRNNNTIRKVTRSGVVTTLAGSSIGAFGSTNGTGSAARFWSPSDVAVDSTGNVYVSDTNNHTIRKVTPSGVVTTLAGTAGSTGSTDGTGSAARFNSPLGMAVDSAGNVYVADTFNHTIRKVDPAGVVTTLAGFATSSGSTDGTGSAARFTQPSGLALDSAGNVYVADRFNHTIRKVTPSGVVTTLAGTALSSGSTDGTGGAARFNRPYDVAVDSSNNVYVADRDNHTIRKVTSAGVVTTVGGTAGVIGYNTGYGSAGFYLPSGIAVSSEGRVIVANNGSHRIVNVELVGSQPILTQNDVSGIDVSGVTLNGTVNPNGFLTTAAFEYGLTTDYGNTVSVILSPSNGTSAQNVSAELNALRFGTLYHYRLTATNIDGSASTIGGTFTTPLISETYHAPSGQSLSYQIASTSELPVTFSATGLPAGLTLDPVTGIISGTVAAAGTYSVTTTVSNGGEESSGTLTLVVSASALPFISGAGTIQACMGQGLNHSFDVANSPSSAGILGLPPGLWQTDSNDDGIMDLISGTPLIAGSFRVTFWAENALGRCTRSAIIRVNKPSVTASAQLFEGLDVRAVAKDSLGNTVLGARIHGPVVVGGTTYTPMNFSSDGLVIKISPTGQVIWVYQLTGTYGCELESLVVDRSGNIITCGEIDSFSSTFAGSAVSGQTFFVVKLTSAGTHSWTRVQGVGGDNVYCGALAVDGSNNIWVGGYFQGSLGFSNTNNTTLNSSSLEASNNGYVAGFSSSGTVLTPRLFGSTSVSHINSLAAAPDGTVFVAGDFSGNLTVPGSGSAPTASITLTNPDGNASQPSFVACIGGVSAGTTTHAAYWARQIPDGHFFQRNCMVADSSGGLYVTGYEDLTAPPASSLPADSIALPENRSGTFLMRLSATSTYGLSWIKDLPGTGVPALAYDGVASLYLENRINYGNFDDMVYSGSTGRYLAKLSTLGAVHWVRDSVNATNNDYPFFAADSGGNLSLASMSDGATPLSTGDQSVSGAGTGLFLLSNPPDGETPPVITSTLSRSWVASRSYSREYTYQIQASNSPTSYWVSDLPEGAQFDESTGVITATPTEAGSYTSTIWAMNASGYASATLIVTVTPDPDPEITSPATTTATVGQPFSYQITATNSPTSFSASGPGLAGGLLDGLSFNATAGLIQGTPILPGSTFFTVGASNATGNGSLFVTLTVAANPAIAPPTVQATSITATVGQPLSYQIQATGALRYGATSAGSPASGLICDRSTGLISWTPAAAGTYTITLQGINGGGSTSALLQITVSPANGGGVSLTTWRQQYFGSDQNTGDAADLAVPDGDGIPNLIKYALLMTPGQNGSSRLPQAALTNPSGNHRLTLTFQRDPLRNDVSIVVEAQSGLGGTWSEIARSTNGAGFTGSAAVSETNGANGAKSVTVQDVQTNAPHRFMRVRVVR